MNSFTVIWRELIQQSRGSMGHRLRSAAVLGAFGCAVWAALFSSGGTGVGGRPLLLALSYFGLGFSLLSGVFRTAGLVCREKRDGTLGLLFLTDLKGIDVAFGKLAASSLGILYGLLAVIPALSIGLLLGGIEPVQIASIAGLLLVCLVFSLSTGLLVGTIVNHERVAALVTAGVAGILAFGPLLASVTLGALFPDYAVLFEEPWVSGLSPFSIARACVEDADSLLLNPLTQVWMGTVAALSLSNLGAVARIMPTVWMGAPKVVPVSAIRRRARAWLKGEPAKKLAHRAKALDRCAFAWMALRDYQKRRAGWVLAALMVSISGMFLAVSPTTASGFEMMALFAWVVLAAVKAWTVTESCEILAEAANSGALELVLSTPVGPREIARGHWLAWRAMLGLPLMVISLLTLATGLAHSFTPTDPNDVFVAIFFAVAAPVVAWMDVWAIRWVGMEAALRWRRANPAITVTGLKILLTPWVIAALCVGGRSVWQGHHYDFDDFAKGRWLPFWTAASMVTNMVFGLPARVRFGALLRAFAVNNGSIMKEVRPAGKTAWIRRHPFASALLAAACFALCVEFRAIHFARKLERTIKTTESVIAPLSIRADGQWMSSQSRVSENENVVPWLDAATRELSGQYPGYRSWLASFPATNRPTADQIMARYSNVTTLIMQACRRTEVCRLPSSIEVNARPNAANVSGIIEACHEASLAKGRIDESTDLLLLQLRLARSLFSVLSPAYHDAGDTVLNSAKQMIEKVLPRRVLSARRLGELEMEIARLEAADAVMPRLAMSAADSLRLARKPIAELMQPFETLAAGGGRPELMLFCARSLLTAFIGSGQRDKALVERLQLLADLKPLWEKSPVEAVKLAKTRWNIFQDTLDSVGNLRGSWPYRLESDVETANQLRAMRVALRIEKYILREGDLPVSLDEVENLGTPISARDLWTGKYFDYEVKGESHTLGQPARTGFKHEQIPAKELFKVRK